MTDILPLAQLGRRIMVTGPTNAGKSTLTVALADKLGVPAYHVDLFRHLPHTDWEPRPTEDFHALHAAAIAEPEWVMDGNYSEILPQRLARATGIVVVDAPLLSRYVRYFKRTLQRQRVGALEGGKDSIKWDMIHWLWHTRGTAEAHRKLASETGLPAVFCRDQRDVAALCAAWDLRLSLS
ncbi:AAA family ATPase [Devosia sp. RR2S18]|uniref:AAA family ATPase n=1 Tax=Devosia rhizosphaerae TaxID=3049774 RepID=UPI002540DD99|nr:AAA family ATPase [Devosia sp. RR2S18]WIJ26820.1 AAA family ATPase [Devosia sp. RR2S18]